MIDTIYLYRNLTKNLPQSNKRNVAMSYYMNLSKACAELGISPYTMDRMNVIDLQCLITSMRIDEVRKFKAEQDALSGKKKVNHVKATNADVASL